MPAYITLINFTEQGVKDAKNTVKRMKAAEKAIEASGGRKIGVWWTLGPYDMVFIGESPDAETAVRTALGTAMLGNVRTMTMQAFSEDEMERIVGGLP